MMRRTLQLVPIAVVALVTATVLQPNPAGAADPVPQNYNVSSLPTLPSFDNLSANGINAGGQIVGSGSSNGREVGLLWEDKETDPPAVLPDGGFDGNRPRGISDDGKIVGFGLDNTGATSLFWATPTANPTQLSKGAFAQVEVSGVNSAGQIVGTGYPESGGSQAILWPTPTGTPTPLPQGDLLGSEAWGINDAGAVVGTGFGATSPALPRYWSSLTSAPSPLPRGGTTDLVARGINDAGAIVGPSSYWASPTTDAVLLAGANNSEAFGINDAGNIVGRASGSGTASFWEDSVTSPTALPQGFTTTDALGINDAGQIVGLGVTHQEAVPLYWATPASVPNVLPTGIFFGVTARDINNAGQIVGDGGSPAGRTGLFWASPTSTPVALSSEGFTLSTEAFGMNDAGKIVGLGSSGTGAIPILWASPAAAPVAMSDGGFDVVSAQGINTAGQIAGLAGGIGNDGALFWSSSTADPVALPADGVAGPRAFGISDLGQIVGLGAPPNSSLGPLMWPSPTSAPVVLPGGGRAHGVNNAGLIVGSGATLWTPITTLFLHAQGSSLVMNTTSPTGTAAKHRDSAGLKFAGGNPWKTVGTWTGPARTAPRTLNGATDATAWLGLVDGADQAAYFDVRAEVLKNGIPVASGTAQCVGGLKSNPANAMQLTIPVDLNGGDVPLRVNDTVALRVSTRMGTFGGTALCDVRAKAGGLRLYFDSSTRPSQVGLTFR
jgi:hypothetical protein